MCILFVYVNSKPEPGKYRLILATNRDEYYKRPASTAHHWPGNEHIIAGEDLEPGREGGTWFGLSLKRNDQFQFRIGALLNITGEPHSPDALGRGSIVTNYLRSNQSADEYVRDLSNISKQYSAFGFVSVELNTNETAQILHYSNVTNTLTRPKSTSNSMETYAEFGNSLPHEPLAKVTAGRERFIQIVERLNTIENRNELINELISLLKWDKRHLPDEVLARRTKSTPILADYLSSVFVHVPNVGYGTRTHSLVLVDSDGRVEFVEDTFSENGQPQWAMEQHISNL